MSNEDTPIPEQVFQALLQQATKPVRRNNLEALHRVCRAQYSGNKDFSLATIARLCEAMGYFKGRILYNKPSAPFRELIGAWASITKGQAAPPQEIVSQAIFERLKSIPDPALRAIVQTTVVERNKLRAELNMLKSKMVLNVDLKPQISSSTLQSEQLKTEKWKLSATETEALQRVVSPAFLADEGLEEGPAGEYFNRNGRRVFPIGFARAVRKVLKEF